MEHAPGNAFVAERIAEDPVRCPILGPDRSAHLLELIVMDRPQGPATIHAITMTEQYRALLPGGST